VVEEQGGSTSRGVDELVVYEVSVDKIGGL
jgi:hypothetical protein